MFEVVVFQDGVEIARHPMSPGSVNLGRSDDNHIVLKADSVSRRHARFLVEPGRLVVEDLGSGNGTFIAGERLYRRQELRDGDEVSIAPFALRVVAPNLAQPAGTSADPSADARTVMIPSAGPAAPAAPAAPRFSPGAPTGAKIRVLRGMAARNDYDLKASPFTLGRADDRDMILSDPASSRRHATVHFEGDQYRVIDDGSANGLIVNGQPSKDAYLKTGDRILIGETEMEFSWPGGPAASQPGASLDPSQDPYAETNFMPAYSPWESTETAPDATLPAGPGGPGQAPGYGGDYGGDYGGGYGEYTDAGNQGYGYGMEMAPAPAKKSPLKLVLVALLVLMVAGGGIAVWSKGGTTGGSDGAAQVAGDPCAAYDLSKGCADAADEACRRCLVTQTRMDNGKELFRQQEFGRALQEFQEILQRIDPNHVEAKRMAYLTYEFWVLTNLQDEVEGLSQTQAQKLETLNDEYAKVLDIYERYGKASYSRSTSERVLNSARASLNQGVVGAKKVAKLKIDDEAAKKKQAEVEELLPKFYYQLNKIGGVLKQGTLDDLKGEIEGIFNKAMAAKSGGNNNQALKLLQEVIDSDTKNETGFVDRARQEIAAINASTRATATPHYNKGLSNLSSGLLLEARANFQKALSIDPGYKEAKIKLAEVNEGAEKKGRELYTEAKIQYNVSQYAQAEKLLRQVLDFIPDPKADYHKKAEDLLEKIRQQR